MKRPKTVRTPLYSRASTVQEPVAARVADAAAPATPAAAPSRWRRLAAHPAIWLLGGALPFAIALGLVAVRAPGQALTQKDIDAAVLHTLDNHPLPAPSAKAFAAIQGSLVRVIGERPEPEPELEVKGKGKSKAKPTPKDDEDDEGKGRTGMGSGVVIIDSGVILTNLHVVLGASRIKVVFHDGMESEASVIRVMPEHDLAVLKAHKIPDDLQAATMRSTADLRPGDRVTAVGFPFGIGPSASAGVISGLKREFRSPQGQRLLTNLIQFDAMANPGSSGGPLVTDDGAVIGIVTAIYNPVQQRFFVGIGFAVPIENAAAGAGLPPF